MDVKAAESWLKTHQSGPLGFDPVRSEPLPEACEPGDILDNGDLITREGIMMSYGQAWLNIAHAHNAAFYGWRCVCPNMGFDTATGEQMILMARFPE